MRFPVETRLKDGTPIHLLLADWKDIEPLHRLYEIIVNEGTSYPHDRSLGHEEFLDYWFRGKSTVVAYTRDPGRPAELIGAFYLKPNWPGRARQVANAGFIVVPQWRNKGLGWFLGATELGYRSVIFNLVFSENAAARHVWKKLGFSELAVLPGVVRKNDGTYQDAIIMFRSLV
jgi:RimJ/RimL family protein N-acetyltransferase